MKIADLVAYFTLGIETTPESRQIVGMEIETMFVNGWGEPIKLYDSQYLFECLANNGWSAAEEKKLRSSDVIITKIRNSDGDTWSYELGRHNLELSVHPVREEKLLKTARELLTQMYKITDHRCRFWSTGQTISPLFQPTMAWSEDLLAIPDERDATWLKLDGRKALNFLAKTASVQFMFTVSPDEAIAKLNNLNRNLPRFLSDGEGYPQAKWWEEYIRLSHAGYRPDRFGGPQHFESLEDYCKQLSTHGVVTPGGLVPFHDAGNIDTGLYVRSVWWHFRLRRFGNNLCIEVRPQPRLEDDKFSFQFGCVKAWIEDVHPRSNLREDETF
jgi:hypothetical protein